MALATDENEMAEDAAWPIATESQIGRIVGGTYRISRHIGSGGSSHVFEAEHVRLGKLFALKLLRPEIANGRKVAQRLRREAQAIARIDNQHVVSVIDCGELADHTPYLVMELLEGQDLRSLLQREGRLPLSRATHIVLEACSGLTTVHAAGLVHRDLKPENLFIARRPGGEDWCKILDFGVAKMQSTLSTAQGAIIGTVRYMAPEQLASGASVTPATDVYALGAILYECLAARPLHEGQTVQEVMYSVMNQGPESLTTHCPSLPRSLVEVVRSTLSKAPEHRPQSTAEFAKRIRSALCDDRVGADEVTISEDGLPSSTAPGPGAITMRRGWRLPLAIGCAAGLTLGWLARGASRPADTGAAVAAEPVPPPALSVTSQVARLDSAGLARPKIAAVSAPTASSSAPRVTPRRWQSAAAPRAAQATSITPASAVRAPLSVDGIDVANPYGE